MNPRIKPQRLHQGGSHKHSALPRRETTTTLVRRIRIPPLLHPLEGSNNQQFHQGTNETAASLNKTAMTTGSADPEGPAQSTPPPNKITCKFAQTVAVTFLRLLGRAPVRRHRVPRPWMLHKDGFVLCLARTFLFDVWL